MIGAALLLGAVAAYVVWQLLAPTFGSSLFLRENYRDRLVPTAAGVAVPVVVAIGEAMRAVLAAAGFEPAQRAGPASAGLLVAVLGFGVVGLLDDLAGDGSSRGFRGHLGALGKGRLTTGGLKLAAGGAVAAAAVGVTRPGSGLARFLADALLVALAANLGNLFDRAPGRVIKVGSLAFAALVVATGAPTVLAPVALVAGAAVGLLGDDLQERLMLGDTGANALGAALGIGTVVAASPTSRTVVLVVLVAANVGSEFVSFSRVIDAVPPLRAFDRAGRAR